MRRIRVLVVDDAVVVRRIVTDVLSADPEIEVVGIAANGHIALQKIAQLAPDLVTLDVEMPEMDGLETILEIRKTWRKLPVIMFSTLTERGGTATLEALSRGATDYVTKPANVGSVTVAQQRIRDELIPRIKGLCASILQPVVERPAPWVSPVTRAKGAAQGASNAAMLAASRAPHERIALVAIGSSTGGPNALADVIPKLPADFPVPMVITQHMPPMFTRLLAERLNGLSKLTVREATEGAVLEPGTVWIAPGDFHLVLHAAGTQMQVTLSHEPPENSCRPSVDVMLRSAVACYGRRVLSVILTGMGQDGLRGSQAVKAAGGTIVAQDEATSVVWGMPGFVARAGIAEAVLPIHEVAQAIIDRVPVTLPVRDPRVVAPLATTTFSPVSGVPWR